MWIGYDSVRIVLKKYTPGTLQDDKEKRRLEALERKKENQRLLDEEAAKIKGKQGAKEAAAGLSKVTRAQIEETLHTEQQQQLEEHEPRGNDSVFQSILDFNARFTSNRLCVLLISDCLLFLATEKTHLETPLEENVNRIVPDEGAVEARTIEDAISVLRYWIFCHRMP